MLKAPPEHLPKEVTHALEVRARERVQEAAKLGALGYASLILYLPFIAWMGVIEWGAIALMFVLTALAAGVSLGVARFGPAPAGLLVALFFSTAAMASTGMLFGALLVTPMFIA